MQSDMIFNPQQSKLAQIWKIKKLRAPDCDIAWTCLVNDYFGIAQYGTRKNRPRASEQEAVRPHVLIFDRSLGDKHPRVQPRRLDKLLLRCVTHHARAERLTVFATRLVCG